MHGHESRPERRQLSGVQTITEALQGQEKPRMLLVRRLTEDPEILGLVEESKNRGIPVRYTSSNDLKRMSAVPSQQDVLALLGPDPNADETDVLAGGGAAWLLVQIAYPGNVGFAIRTAEVSGADGIFIDTVLAGRGRHRAIRASMRANRFLPVHWLQAEGIMDRARGAGKRILAIEDSGSKAPWDVDLTGSVLLVIGGEEHGIPQGILEASDEILRIPMAGFIPSYNLHAAMAAVAVERLRQLSARSGG